MNEHATPDSPISDIIHLTAHIVSSHMSKSQVPISDIPNLISDVYRTLSSLGKPSEPKPEILVPAVAIKKSVTSDYIICLEDGRKMKTLRRHLATSYKLTPDQYRARWGLPADYPMVAPSYSEKRKQLAMKSGLGRDRTSTRNKKASKK